MAYFRGNTDEETPYVPYFQGEESREDDGLDGLPDLEDPDELPEELEARRKDRLELLMHLGDFTAVIGGVVVSLVLIALLVSLISWLESDISQTFSLMDGWI